jgi:hypothetical protein
MASHTAVFVSNSSKPDEPPLVKEDYSRERTAANSVQVAPQHSNNSISYFIHQPQTSVITTAYPGATMAAPHVTPPTQPQHNPPPISPAEEHSGDDGDEDERKKPGVPHIYHDYSAVPDSVGYVRKKTGGVTQPFPEKLMELLTKETDRQHVVGWLPHGRAFIVRKPKIFTGEIMPKYFRQSKLTSFQRQLNLYGFRRITQGADAGAYYHELFLRGRPQLCLRMNRQKIKGTGHKQPADAHSEVRLLYAAVGD